MATVQWSDDVLEETPSRATRFISGIGALAVVRTLLEGAGMTDADIEEGAKLLLACLATAPAAAETRDTESAKRQREAVAALDAWDEPNFARYKAALDRRFPAVSERVFRDLSAATGPAAVQGVATLLVRIDGCEHAARKGDEKKASDAVTTAAEAFEGVPAKECEGAVELLAQRGLDRDERARLGGLVKVALGNTTAMESVPASEAARSARRRDAQRALRGWFEEWSATARAVVTRRDQLIRLGLAKRKSPAPKATPTPPTG